MPVFNCPLRERASSHQTLGPYIACRACHIQPREISISGVDVIGQHPITNQENHGLQKVNLGDVNISEILEQNQVDTSGVSSHIYFRVSIPIELTALYFLGPWKNVEFFSSMESTVPSWYGVSARVNIGLHGYNAAIIGESIAHHTCSYGEVIQLHFSRGVFVMPNEWHTVTFYIDGPVTSRLRTVSSDVRVKLFNCDKPFADFEFLQGSKQLLGLEFYGIDECKTEEARLNWQDAKDHEDEDIRCMIVCDCLSSCFV